jgi:beta-glucanase (GH16 family)
MAWNDEFDVCPNGHPDSSKWSYEYGHMRNHEAQAYDPMNALCSNGKLTIVASQNGCVNHDPACSPKRVNASYVAASMTTQSKKNFTYGYFEMRGKVDVRAGSWPAWWTVGAVGTWPSKGEIDIMEYYNGKMHANFCYKNKAGSQAWNGHKIPVDSEWAEHWHTWAMDWNPSSIRLFLDGRLVNTEETKVADGTSWPNPWRGRPVYMILNQVSSSSKCNL